MIKILQMSRNMKVRILFLLTLLLATAVIRQPDQASVMLFQVALALTTAVFAEFAFFGAVKSTSVQSSIITGALIGMLLVPGLDFKILWFTVIVAIASKRLLCFNSCSHIFNPAAIGIILSSLLWGNRLNWWGFSNPYMLIAVGGVILFSLNRVSFVFSYMAFRLIGLLIFNGGSVSVEMLLLPNLFFAFIMLVEPMTTPFERLEQWKFAAGVGLLSSCAFFLLPAFDGDLIALLIMNFARPILVKK